MQADAQDSDVAEQRFYAVMHHLATVLWMKGAAAEALSALSAVVERINQEDGITPPAAAIECNATEPPGMQSS